MTSSFILVTSQPAPSAGHMYDLKTEQIIRHNNGNDVRSARGDSQMIFFSLWLGAEGVPALWKWGIFFLVRLVGSGGWKRVAQEKQRTHATFTLCDAALQLHERLHAADAPSRSDC